MLIRFRLPIAAGVVMAFVAVGAIASEVRPKWQYVSADAVKQLFPGRFYALHEGHKVRFVALENGELHGRAYGFTDTGRWRVSNRQLCISLQKWFKGRTKCAAVIRNGDWYAVKRVLFRKL